MKKGTNSITTLTNGLKSNGNTILAIAVVVASIYALVGPVGQEVEFLKESFRNERDESHAHFTSGAHSGAQEKLGRLSEQFKEVEAQLKGLCIATRIRLESLEQSTGMARHSDICATLLSRP